MTEVYEQTRGKGAHPLVRQSRRGTVTAYRMTEARRSTLGKWPDWLRRDKWAKARKDPDSVYKQKPAQSAGRLTVMCAEGEFLVKWGWWIIIDEGGLLLPPLSHADFNNRYRHRRGKSK